jgi:Bacterial regulatory proteins, tetR family
MVKALMRQMGVAKTPKALYLQCKRLNTRYNLRRKYVNPHPGPDLMNTSEQPRRPGLTRAVITEAALSVADAGGLESLTMRAVAKALGVEAMSLYNHVSNNCATVRCQCARCFWRIPGLCH